MTTFWIITALLMFAAMGLLSWYLWRKPAPSAAEESVDALNVLRDQRLELDQEVAAGRLTAEEREARIADLARRVHDEGLATADAAVSAPDASGRRRLWLAAVVAVLVPAIAVPTYFLIGTPAALDPTVRAAGPSASPHGEFTPEQLNVLLEKIKQRLQAQPDDVTGWLMLARGSQMANDFRTAASAFERANALKPNDAELLADYADALAMAQNRDLSGKPWELIQQALQLNPQLPKALALAASAEMRQNRNESAKGYWQRLLAQMPPDSESANQIRNTIAQLEGKPPGSPAAPGMASAAPAAPAVEKPITGTVKLAPALAGKVAPDDVLYVFARVEGSRMPLAIARLKASELPKEFRLDDSHAMPGGLTLSAAPQVRVEARVSKSGDALPRPGDLRGESAPVAPGSRNIEIVISEVIMAAPGAATASPPAPPLAAAAPAPPAAAPAPPAASTAPGAGPTKAIAGTIKLAPALAAKIAPSDTLFVFARPAEGSRMPLAIMRLKASELPKQFRLDDTMGMAGGPVLSATPQVRIEARVSKTGEALPKSGDLRGESTVVAPGAGNVEVVIDRIVP